MKKILIILFVLLMCTACSTPKQEESNENLSAGSWQINENIEELEGDVYFLKATSEYTGMDLKPLFVLGSQIANPSNYAYLCLGKTATAKNYSFKVAIIAAGDNSEDVTVLNVADFNLTDYLDNEGSNTPEGLMGGWQDTQELPNTLDSKTNAVFDKALEGFTGVGYKAVALLGRQVVAGENYAILATDTSVTAEPITHLCVLNIYEDLDGNVTINNICGIDLSSFNK